MHRLESFNVDDLVACSAAFKKVTAGAASLEEAAQSIVTYLYEHMVDERGEPACPLIRFYKTHRYDGLDRPLQDFARGAAGASLMNDTRCLTLLATRGREFGWNDRQRSAGHRAIPLVSAETVERSPMIASLLHQLGVDLAEVIAPQDQPSIGTHHRDYDVFFVPEANGDPRVPAQEDFVVPYGIHSVVGCGGVLPSGDLFALILFTTLHLDVATAELFRTLAMSVKASLVPLTFSVFAETDLAG